jgi:hypothetical protein
MCKLNSPEDGYKASTSLTPWFFSPQANYTDRATAACHPNRGCRVVSATDPHGRNLDFLDPEPLLFHSSSSSVILTRLSGPRSRPTISQKIW